MKSFSLDLRMGKMFGFLRCHCSQHACSFVIIIIITLIVVLLHSDCRPNILTILSSLPNFKEHSAPSAKLRLEETAEPITISFRVEEKRPRSPAT